MAPTSIHLDKYGKVLGNYNDGDNSIYLHKDATSYKDYKKNYNSKTNTSAGGVKIGELGKRIDANGILDNLLSENIKYAVGIVNPFTFKNLVRGKGDWDLKNNKNTIYGVANAFDKANGTSTEFSFNGGKYSAPDIGNFHYGAVGSATWFGEEGFLLKNAGAAQMTAGTSRLEWQKYVTNTTVDSFGNTNTSKTMLPPYGDDPYDQKMIKLGIIYQKNQ
ncbi:polymorphic toxin type 44 domain-containing protein [Pedobacter vanadiisoli]|uniref:Polymorphic toxin type 44 domain-containing protein n=1 Tax=Pedobacter vanadiisoli TaxID=1761975 RepID=A0ABW5MQ51_9SPHI